MEKLKKNLNNLILDPSLHIKNISKESILTTNELFNNLKEIFESYDNNEDILNNILNISINGEKIFNNDDEKYINQLKINIPKFKLFLKSIKQLNKQKGGVATTESLKPKIIPSDYYYEPSTFKNVILDFKNISEKVLGNIVFVLHNLENNKKVGKMISTSLNITDVILQNLDLVFEFIGPIIDEVKDIVFSILGIVPVVGEVSSVIELIVDIFDEVILYFFEDGLDIISLFINISRKDWDMALNNLLEVVPKLPEIMGTLITNIHRFNSMTEEFLNINTNPLQLLKHPVINNLLEKNLHNLPINALSKIVKKNIINN